MSGWGQWGWFAASGGSSFLCRQAARALSGVRAVTDDHRGIMNTVGKRAGMAATVLAAALGTVAASPASAQTATTRTASTQTAVSEAPASSGSRGNVEFSVVDTGAGVPRDRAFKLGDLTKYDVPKKTMERIAAGKEAGAEARTAQAPPPDRNDIVAEWKDKDGWDAVMRQGWWDGANAGFGMRKIDQKHNLSLDAVKATTMYPRPGPTGKENIGGTTWNYRTEVLHVECSGWWIFRTCRVTDVKTVRAGLDYRKLDDNKSFGAVTAFCENVPGRCPDWVRNAINL